MTKKSPQQLASEYKKDSPMIRAGFIKAMNLIIGADSVPENVKQIALDCINIISGLDDYVEKEFTVQEPPELPKTTEVEPLPEAPKNPASLLPPASKSSPNSANRRFRRS